MFWFYKNKLDTDILGHFSSILDKELRGNRGVSGFVKVGGGAIVIYAPEKY